MTSHRGLTIWVAVTMALLLLGTNAWWLGRDIDRGVSRAHADQALSTNRRALNLLSSLLVSLPRGITADSAFAYLKAVYPEEVVKLDGAVVEIGDILLRFEGDTLVQASPM